MKQTDGEKIKAMATRALLTCRCTHQQIDHVHQMKDGWIVGIWRECLIRGCNCQGFRGQLSSGDKRDMDRVIDRKVEASTLAAVMQNQPIPIVTRVSQFPPSRSIKYKGKRPKERVHSAPQAGVSPLYHQTPTRKEGEPYEP